MEATISREEFAFLIRRAGVTVPEATLDELYGVYGHIEASARRVRAGGDAEPAHVFAPIEEPT